MGFFYNGYVNPVQWGDDHHLNSVHHGDNYRHTITHRNRWEYPTILTPLTRRNRRWLHLFQRRWGWHCQKTPGFELRWEIPALFVEFFMGKWWEIRLGNPWTKWRFSSENHLQSINEWCSRLFSAAPMGDLLTAHSCHHSRNHIKIAGIYECSSPDKMYL